MNKTNYSYLLLFIFLFSTSCDDDENVSCNDPTQVIDDCGICVGGPTDIEPCIMDCAEVLGGTFWVSDCGCVDADNSGDECDDCAGNPNGTAGLDLCGNCVEDLSDSSYECEAVCD